VIFTELELPGAYVVDVERHEDERGWFARLFDDREFALRDLQTYWPQVSSALNKEWGTLRGLHYQEEPHGEAKLVRCVRGSLHDVIVDLRADSPTFRRWAAIELSSANGRMVYVPEGLAHGYLTLEDETEALYLISEPYNEAAASGVRWDDPAFGIEWPAEPRVMSDKDKAWPDFNR
jgi:dTDP-4-dehydrorhamnose 3,5-epimerase